MSVFGVDIGTNNSVVAVTRNGGVDVIINEVSKRETAAFVSLGEGEREIGERGFDRVVRNSANTISQLKRFIGMRADDPALASEKRFLFCNTGADSEGRLTFEVTFQDESVSLLPEQVLAMYLFQLQQYVNREAGNTEVKDCVLSCPVYFTMEQRRLLQQACEVAQLNCMSIMNETTAAAVDYGIFRGSSLPEKEEDAQTVAIVDIGYGDATVTIAKFWKGSTKILAHAYDKECGTREVDFGLATYFTEEIQKKYKVDCRENKRSRIRLLQACEKVKCMLSANKTAPLNIENLQDIDVNINNFQRDQMEEIIAPTLNKFKAVVAKAIEIAGVDVATFTSVEMIGGGCRIPCMKAACEEAFGRPPSFTLNTSESIARGCAITAAVFSPKFQVREFVVNERTQYPIKLAYHAENATAVSEIPFLPQCNKAISIMKEGDAFPKVLELTFERSDAFTLYGFYDDNNEEIKARLGDRMVVGEWLIGAHSKTTTGETKVRVRFAANGMMSIEKAFAEELYEAEVEEEQKKEDGTVEKVMVKKEKKRKQELTVQPKLEVIGLPAEVVLAAKKTEMSMRKADSDIIRAKEAKNELESLVLDNRSRLSDGGSTAEYVTKDDQAKFLKLANEYEEWLYDEGHNTTVAEYQKRIDELAPIANGALKRSRQFEDIPFYMKNTFTSNVKAVRKTASDKLGKCEWITADELNGAMDKCDGAIQWAENQVDAYKTAPKHENPNFTEATMDAKVKEIEAIVRAVVNKPAPPPPKEEEKPKEEGEKTEEKKADVEGEKPADANAEPKVQADLD